MNDAAAGQEQERHSQRHAILKQQLKDRDVTFMTNFPSSSQDHARGLVYLDDEEHGGGRVEGSVIQSDYSGAVSAEQIPHLEFMRKRNG